MLLIALFFALGAGHASAVDFTDTAVQAPALKAPERGSVAGSLSALSVGPGDLVRGSYSLALPVQLPGERGPAGYDFTPSYSIDAGLTEWGMGWQVPLAVQRSPLKGEVDYSSDEFTSPFGRLIRGTDGDYYVQGMKSRHRFFRSKTLDTFEAVAPDGTTYSFQKILRGQGGVFAWYLSEVNSLLGERTRFFYEPNPSGKLFLTRVDYGFAGNDYSVRLDYEAIPTAFRDYSSGVLLELERRVSRISMMTRNAETGQFEVRWFYHPTDVHPECGQGSACNFLE
jgi:hypothetical protein